MTNTTSKPSTETLLTHLRDVLTEVETVLVHAGPATRDEITEILAEHANNHGGHGLLIDTIQFATLDIDRHTNH